MARELLFVHDVSKLFVAVVVLSACGFAPRTLEVRPDAREHAETPLTTDAAEQLAFCHSQLPGVVLCFDFESSTLDLDDNLQSVDRPSRCDRFATSIRSRLAQQAAKVTSLVDHRSGIAAARLVSPLSIELWPLMPASSKTKPTILQHDNGFGDSTSNHAPGCASTTATTCGRLAGRRGLASRGVHAGWLDIRTYVDGSIVACANVDARRLDPPKRGSNRHGLAGGIDDTPCTTARSRRRRSSCWRA